MTHPFSLLIECRDRIHARIRHVCATRDPSGKCSSPALYGGEVGVCIDAYISTAQVGGILGLRGVGDNRGPDPYGGSFRAQFLVTFDPSDGMVEVSSQPGISKAELFGFLTLNNAGEIPQENVNSSIDENGNAQVNIEAAAVNGFASYPGPAPTDPINLFLSLTITPSGTVTVNPGSRYSGFPSLEIWAYRPGQGPAGYNITEDKISDLGTWGAGIPGLTFGPGSWAEQLWFLNPGAFFGGSSGSATVTVTQTICAPGQGLSKDGKCL